MKRMKAEPDELWSKKIEQGIPRKPFFLFHRFILIFCMAIVPVYANVSEVKGQIKIEPVKKHHQRVIIVLVHGLMRTSLSMWPLKIYLKKQGYEVYSYSYPSSKYTILHHGVYLNRFIKNLLAKNPDVPIHLITHSLGGIIAREALSKLSENQLKNMGSLIMLAPPNQGSELARLSTQTFPMLTSPIKPLTELSSDKQAYVHHVPVPNVKIGIIAGRYDTKVPPEFARLRGQKDPVIVDSNHTFIMNNAQSKQLILNFLEKGSFNHV